MTAVVQSRWLALTVGILAYWLATAWALRPQRWFQLPAVLQAGEPEPPKLVTSWEFKNPEMDAMLREIREAREGLRVRAQQLDELQARLAAERQEILAATQTVWQLRQEMDRAFVRIKGEESVNLKRLAKVYSTMTPEGAARILKEFEDDQLVRILAFMREGETAPILEAIGKDGGLAARRVAAISDRLRTLSKSADPPASAP